MDIDGKEVGGTERSRGEETIIRVYYVRKESVFNEKKIERKRNILPNEQTPHLLTPQMLMECHLHYLPSTVLYVDAMVTKTDPSSPSTA